MLRSLPRLCRSLQACAGSRTSPVLHLTRGACPGGSAALVNPGCGLHTSCAVGVLDKDLKGKKRLIRMGQDAKQESLESTSQEVEIDLEGLSSSGITVPTLETLSMTVNGVRFDELPIVHVQSSPNNTIITMTNYTGQDVIAVGSCGMEGFKHVKKSTNVAAQATGFSMGYKAKRKGIKAVRVKVKGLGAGRLASIKGLQMAGVQIVSITDTTAVPHSGPRPRKQKRL